MVVDENGKKIASEWIDEKYLGDYYNVKIVKDSVNGKKEREIEVIVYNSKGDIIS